MALNVEKLRAAIKRDERNLRPFRDKRVEMVKAYCGTDYGPLTEDKPVYLPVIHQAVDTYTQVLAANRPRALVTAWHPELKWFAAHFQRALNNHIKTIGLEHELRMAVVEACFTIGVMKVYYGEDEMVALEGTEDQYVDPGRPYAEHVSLDNFGFDTTASSWRKIQYAYDRYSVPARELRESYPDAAEAINAAVDKDRANDGEEVANSITNVHHGDDYIDQVWVMDVWLPAEQKIVTLLADSDSVELAGSDEVLREIEWEGPKHGPYRILNFSDTPDNVIGVSPCMKLMKLGNLMNHLYRKQVNQARRSRDLPIFEPGSEDDARKLQSAEDGRWTCVKNRDSVGVLKMGGVDPSNQQFGISVMGMFDRMAGNLQAMAGLGPQADTLGQDQIIQSQVSKSQSKMQERMVDFTAGVMRDIGWLLWHDVAQEIGTEYEIPGTGLMARSNWSPEHREGKFLDYNFDIEPFSMQYQSPSQRANGMLSYVSNIAVPMMEMLMQQGGTLDFKQLTEYYAELMNLPRLKDIVTFQADQRDELKPAMEPPAGQKPKNTTRTHVRNNVSTGPAQQDQGAEMQQALAAMAAQGGGMSQPQKVQGAV